MAYPGGDLPTITQAQSEFDSAYTLEANNTNGYIISNTIAVPGLLFIADDKLFKKYGCSVVQDDSSQLQVTNPLKFVSASKGLFDINYYGDHDVTLNLSTGAGGTKTYKGDYKLIIYTYKNNVLIATDNVYNGTITSASTSVTYSFDYKRAINVDVNDQITIQVALNLINVSISTTNQAGNYSSSIQCRVKSNTANLDIIKQQQSLSAGGTVFLSPFLPDMTCDDFFKGLVTAFNLYVKPSNADPTIMEIEPLADFYNASGDALDWSDKLDRSSEIKIEPTINFSSKNYNFNFEQDNDYWNTRYLDDVQKQYGSFLIQSQSQFAVNDTNFKLPFSQKLLARIPDTSPGAYTDLIVPRSFQVKFNEDGTSLIEKKKGKPFIVQLGGLRTGAWNHRDETGTDHAETDYPYVGHLNSLDSPTFDFNFGVPDYVFWSTTTYTTNNLYLYHEKFIKELISRFGKQVSCSIMLRPSDINSLDFRNLINIDGVVYRLLKINDYQSGKNVPTTVELIRIIEGEGIQSTIVTPPYDPFTDPLARYTSDDDARITDDGQVRFVNP